MLVEEANAPAHSVAAALIDAGYRLAERLPGAADLATAADRIQPDAVLVCTAAAGPDVLAKLLPGAVLPACPVVLATAEACPDTRHRAIDAGVSAFLFGDVDAERIRGAIDLAVARSAELDAVKRELDETRKKLAARKVIERAKGLLMQRSGLDEDSAYRTLRKLAMDKNLKLVDAAENLLAVAEVIDNRSVATCRMQASAAALDPPPAAHGTSRVE